MVGGGSNANTVLLRCEHLLPHGVLQLSVRHTRVGEVSQATNPKPCGQGWGSVLARLLHADPTLWPLPESAARLRMVGKRPRVPSPSRRSRTQESKAVSGHRRMAKGQISRGRDGFAAWTRERERMRTWWTSALPWSAIPRRSKTSRWQSSSPDHHTREHQLLSERRSLFSVRARAGSSSSSGGDHQ